MGRPSMERVMQRLERRWERQAEQNRERVMERLMEESAEVQKLHRDDQLRAITNVGRKLNIPENFQRDLFFASMRDPTRIPEMAKEIVDNLPASLPRYDKPLAPAKQPSSIGESYRRIAGRSG